MSVHNAAVHNRAQSIRLRASAPGPTEPHGRSQFPAILQARPVAARQRPNLNATDLVVNVHARSITIATVNCVEAVTRPTLRRYSDVANDSLHMPGYIGACDCRGARSAGVDSGDTAAAMCARYDRNRLGIEHGQRASGRNARPLDGRDRMFGCGTRGHRPAAGVAAAPAAQRLRRHFTLNPHRRRPTVPAMTKRGSGSGA